MPVLREDSVVIMDGAIKLYRRERSRNPRVGGSKPYTSTKSLAYFYIF